MWLDDRVLKGFRDFILRGNVVDLAVAVVIGAAFTAVVNAFAAPGGYIVVYRGLLDQAATTEEFAGVLGHEMQHVILKHSDRAIARRRRLRHPGHTRGLC